MHLADAVRGICAGVVMRLKLQSFEACIDNIAAGMALDEALELIARGDLIAAA